MPHPTTPSTRQDSIHPTAARLRPLPIPLAYRQLPTAPSPQARTLAPPSLLSTNEAQGLEDALARVGPVSVTVAASRWQLYGGGVFEGCR